MLQQKSGEPNPESNQVLRLVLETRHIQYRIHIIESNDKAEC